ncbi:MAG TPA: hypothetical protein VNF99_03210 [Stellaceae bacterium]|nr:hypothetical protein [Stellaceae bacterium]
MDKEIKGSKGIQARRLLAALSVLGVSLGMMRAQAAEVGPADQSSPKLGPSLQYKEEPPDPAITGNVGDGSDQLKLDSFSSGGDRPQTGTSGLPSNQSKWLPAVQDKTDANFLKLNSHQDKYDPPASNQAKPDQPGGNFLKLDTPATQHKIALPAAQIPAGPAINK